MTPPPNPFSTLGLDISATDSDIKKAFRRLARKYHPDNNNGDPDFEEKFKEINRAYKTITRLQEHGCLLPVERPADETNASWKAGGGLGSRLTGFLWGGGWRASTLCPAPGDDVQQNVNVSFIDSIIGAPLSFRTTAHVTCERCGGNGAHKGSSFATCPRCHGVGQVLEGSRRNLKTVFCPTCYGGGRVIRVRCRRCHGQGRVKGRRKVTFYLPPGAEDGDKFLMTGKGNTGVLKGPAGDLIIKIAVGKHPLFTRNRSDIHCDVHIPFTVAALGGHVTADTVTGTVKIKIPPGTAAHSSLRLKGRGVSEKGDQYMRVVVDIPTRLSEREKELLRSFAHLRGQVIGDSGKKGFLRSLLKFFRAR